MNAATSGSRSRNTERTARVLAGALLLAAGLSAANLASSSRALADAGFLTAKETRVVTPGLIGIDLLVAGAMLFSATRRLAALVCLFLCFLLSSSHAYVVIAGEAIDRGCAGVEFRTGERPTHIAMLAISTLMVGLSARIVLISPGRDAGDRENVAP